MQWLLAAGFVLFTLWLGFILAGEWFARTLGHCYTVESPGCSSDTIVHDGIMLCVIVVCGIAACFFVPKIVREWRDSNEAKRAEFERLRLEEERRAEEQRREEILREREQLKRAADEVISDIFK